MKQILFPTAYADHSRVAYRYAQELAQYFGANITLAHIYHRPLPSLDSEFEVSYEDRQQELMIQVNQQREEELAKLKAFANEMGAKKFQNILLDFIVMEGKVVDELIDILDHGYDLVIMGMRRHNRISRFLGNTTYTLIEELNCPILLIPPGAYFFHIDKIVYGTAFEFGNKKAIDHLLDWCLAFEASLHMVHLHNKSERLKAESNIKKLKMEFTEEDKIGIITFQMKEGRTKNIIDWYTEFNTQVLLAVHWRKQGFFQEIMEGNLTKSLAEKTQMPLLIMKY